MKNFLSLIFISILTNFNAQGKEYDSLLLEKVSVAAVKENALIGTNINEKCQLENNQFFKPIHNSLRHITIVTDYILCNDGKANMFFEIYDTQGFKYIRDYDLKLSENLNIDEFKVKFSKQTIEEKTFIHNNINKIIDFIIDYGDKKDKEEVVNSIEEALNPFTEVKKYGLGIINYNATEGYSATGADFKIFNPSKKTIKYIWFTVGGENPVGDLVKSGGKYYRTLKGVGPIESFGVGSWSFDYVWFTDLIEYLRITTIKIQYMDGSIKTIKYNKNMYIGESAYENFISAVNKEEELTKKQSERNLLKNGSNIFEEVELTPEFPGGQNSFISQIKSNLIQNEYGKSEFSFIIEKDGSISNIDAIGDNEILNKDIIQSIKNIKYKWIPAKINSTPVRYHYKSLINIY
ncbi:hypothetical protein [uncultured Chryseobacterium sp.]|uniref:energy transducer TonB n=1 Tax=uncultured Chryseobacterium sp. TaxID=259322 RepID=UPI0026000880|nr:hypothetical protein [uncultured Chryseobacterium sp.]